MASETDARTTCPVALPAWGSGRVGTVGGMERSALVLPLSEPEDATWRAQPSSRQTPWCASHHKSGQGHLQPRAVPPILSQ